MIERDKQGADQKAMAEAASPEPHVRSSGGKRALLPWAMVSAVLVGLVVLQAGCGSLETMATSGGSSASDGLKLMGAGRFRDAEPVFFRALKAAESQFGTQSSQASHVLFDIGLLYSLQGRYGEAEPFGRRALAIQESARDVPKLTLASTLNQFGLILVRQGRYADAEPIFNRALRLYEQSPVADVPGMANVIENTGYLLRLQGRYDEARPHYERALALNEKTLGSNDTAVARNLSNLGTLAVLQNRPRDAEPLELRALRIREAAVGPEHPQVVDSLYDLGKLYLAEHRFADSEQMLSRGIATQERTAGAHHPLIATRGLSTLVDLYLESGRPAAAAKASDRAVTILEAQLADGRPERAITSDTERKLYRDVFLKNIGLVYSGASISGDAGASASFAVAQYAGSTSAGQALSQMASRAATGGGPLAADLRRLQDLGERWRQLDADFLRSSKDAPSDQAKAANSTGAAIDGVERELDAVAEKINRDYPAYADLVSSRAIQLAAVQKLLAPDEAFLQYLTTADGTWLWAVRAGAARLYKLAITAGELAEEVRSLRLFLDPDTNQNLRPFPVRRAYGLYQRILQPAEPTLQGVRRILVVPDGALNSLPISVLVTQPPPRELTAAADHRNVHWLARDYAVTVLPTAASLSALRLLARNSHASSPFLGVGDPVLDQSSQAAERSARSVVSGVGPVVAPRLASLAPSLRDPGAAAQAVESLPSLPETAIELKAIAQLTGAPETDLLLGSQANESRLEALALSRYRVIEFATHGLKPGDLGLDEAALVLTPSHRPNAVLDGLLTASKVANLKLDADWVVLSACNTAASEGSEPSGFSALARGFFYAGARSVLISHWSVPFRADRPAYRGSVCRAKGSSDHWPGGGPAAIDDGDVRSYSARGTLPSSGLGAVLLGG